MFHIIFFFPSIFSIFLSIYQFFLSELREPAGTVLYGYKHSPRWKDDVDDAANLACVEWTWN